MTIELFFFLSLFIFLILFSFLLMRNTIISNARSKASKITGMKASEYIGLYFDFSCHSFRSEEMIDLWRKYWENYDSYPSYERMLFSFSKWRFKEFYPGLEEFIIKEHLELIRKKEASQ